MTNLDTLSGVRHDPAVIRPSLEIANRYLYRELSAYAAASRLKYRGVFGKLLAGEVLLDTASQSRRHLASSFIELSRSYFNSATRPHPSERAETSASHVAKASLRKSQLDVYSSMFSEQRLPGKGPVMSMYGSLVRKGLGLVASTYGHQHERTDTQIELRGLIGETSALLLAQRFDQRILGDGSMLAMQSFFREDNGLDCTKVTDEAAWDITIFSQLSAREPISTPYKIQVKTAERYDAQEAHRDVTPLNIHPDLALRPNEAYIPEKIIWACMTELQGGPDARAMTYDLDARTEKFLDVLA